MRKINKMQMHEMVANEIKTYITVNKLENGDKLPSVEKMMELLGVGRSSLREALRYLEATDVVEVKNGKGVYVKDGDLYHISAKVKVEDEKNALLYALEVRRAMEGAAVELAALRATEEQLQQLDLYLHQLETLEGKENSAADMRFHQTIYEASGNPVLQSLVESVWAMFHQFWVAPFGKQEIFDDTRPLHRTMAEAIRSKDKVRAREQFDRMMDIVETAIRNV